MSAAMMSLRQAAEYMGYSYDGWRRLCNDPRNNIPHRRIGAGRAPTYRFFRADLDRWARQAPPRVDVRTGRVVHDSVGDE